jgi:alpha-beta hydrolase superfamily lysophospholipase
LAFLLIKKNINVNLVDLSGFGYSGGQPLNMPMNAHIADLMTVIRFVRQKNKNLPIFLYGHSVGALICINFLTLNRY